MHSTEILRGAAGSRVVFVCAELCLSYCRSRRNISRDPAAAASSRAQILQLRKVWRTQHPARRYLASQLSVQRRPPASPRRNRPASRRPRWADAATAAGRRATAR
eukprot:scaffold164_cov409-Prasinococcus_capsulatus_cf.AAC.13